MRLKVIAPSGIFVTVEADSREAALADPSVYQLGAAPLTVKPADEIMEIDAHPLEDGKGGQHPAQRLTVKLHGEENVILSFAEIGEDSTPIIEPMMWGFSTQADFKRYVKMLLRFDEAMSS